MNLKENLDWRIWSKNDLLEERTYHRAKGNLPEMESAKQLRQIIGNIKDDESVLDVGCASGHYYNSIKIINAKCKYTGVDATEKYIISAKEIFKNYENVNFLIEDIYNLKQSADIVFCCNVLLHLPSVEIPLKNLLKSANKRLIVRSLFSPKTHLAQFCYSDKFDQDGNPTDFLFQNTYSFDFISDIVLSNGSWSLNFIEDNFNSEYLDKEGKEWIDKQGFQTTRVYDGLQTSGDKVYRWGWLVCEKK